MALKSCKGDSFFGTQIHGFAVTSGFISYITVPNSLMNMYCKAGKFEVALRIFENLNDPDIVSWNTLLAGFRKREDALNFALWMNSNRVAFDAVTYTTMLAFCLTKEEFLFASQLHSMIVRSGFDCDVFVGNALITMYARQGCIEEARRVFDGMPKRDLITWNAIISGYSQEIIYGLEATLLFVDMVRQSFKLDHVSFTSVISACGHEKNLEFGKQAHGLSIKVGYGKHVSVCNVLISTYLKCGVIEDAKLVFERMKDRNVVSWTTMISASTEDAVYLFEKMRSDGVHPNEVTFVSLIHAITNEIMVAEGRMVHGLCLKTSFLSESVVCNSFITMYAKFRSMEDSEKVFEELNSKDTITWNALISGYTESGLYQQALSIFSTAIIESKLTPHTFGSILSAIGGAEDISLNYGQKCHSQIIKLGLNTDPIVSNALLDMYGKRGSISESEKVFEETPQKSPFSWTSIISAYARHGDYNSVMTWFKKMETEKVTPDSITFLSVLTACGRKGMVEIGRKIFDSMVRDYKIEPSSEHYSCMVDMLGRAGKLMEAENLVNQVHGKRGISMLQSLLGACKIHGNLEIGERMADDLMEMEPTESGSYVLMSNLYAEKGDWGKVANVRKKMRERGVKKEVGFSWVDIGKLDKGSSLYGFSSGDKRHPQSEQICEMADCLGSEMKRLREEQNEMFVCDTNLHEIL
ncbi:hypothetical protein ACFE04_001245 [Oxalis oulophora]